MTQEVTSGIAVFAVRTPTLPPATHTNTYIIGHGRTAWVVDPASPYPEEQTALDEALSGRDVAGILLTHHHADHVGGAEHLAARTGAQVIAHPATAARVRVPVTRTVGEGDVIDAGGVRLRALHTPGHAPGHLVFVDEDTHAGIAGDMVASIGTIIVVPADDGDMRQYLASLERMKNVGLSMLLPAHGPPLVGDEATAKLDFYIRHRLEREARVFAALSDEPRPLEALLPAAYPDVTPAVYPLASQSLLAHLLKLEQDGRARRVDGNWQR
jgi:glyoxylase-like metal-dependent hydrolase (beta-lactamase superfamily II)